jgi:antitoxin VapB
MWYITGMSDVLHIENPKAAALARELAERTGESVSDVVVHALEHEIERNPRRRERASREEILKIVEEMHKLPILDPRSADELVGYDEDGLPS